MTEPITEQPWLSDEEPFDVEDSAAQIAGVLELLGNSRRHVLDLGCGAGRVLLPPAQRGHQVVGIDSSTSALDRCRARCEEAGVVPTLIHADFLRGDWPPEPRRFDAITLLGNTLMTIADCDAAASLLSRAADRLAPAGMLLIDDIPGMFWPELAEGNWQSGMSEDGQLQMIWHSRDAVFTIRQGDSVDPDSWTIKPDDVRYRLWTESMLREVARRAGLSEPVAQNDRRLIVLRPQCGVSP